MLEGYYRVELTQEDGTSATYLTECPPELIDGEEYAHAEITRLTATDINRNEVLQVLEAHAESANLRSWVGMYRQLYDLAREMMGDEKAVTFLYEVAERYNGFIP